MKTDLIIYIICSAIIGMLIPLLLQLGFPCAAGLYGLFLFTTPIAIFVGWLLHERYSSDQLRIALIVGAVLAMIAGSMLSSAIGRQAAKCQAVSATRP